MKTESHSALAEWLLFPCAHHFVAASVLTVRLVPVDAEDDRNLVIALVAGLGEVDDAAFEEQLATMAHRQGGACPPIVAEAMVPAMVGVVRIQLDRLGGLGL